jgi:hypothetical protein
MYSAFLAIVANLIVTVVLTPVCRWFDVREPADETSPEDYLDDREASGEPGIIPA